jgi:hypothetical protein
MVTKGVKETDFPTLLLPDLNPCFISDSNGGRYETYCSEGRTSNDEL